MRRIYNDAREVMMTSRDKYDLIISEPSNPYRAGIASLFTVDFYRSVRARMNDGGLFVHGCRPMRSIPPPCAPCLSTLGEVFPQIEIWQSNPGDLLLVCGAAPIEYQAERLRAALAQEPFKSGLRISWRINSLEGALAYFVAGPAMAEKVRAADKDRRINTDDRNIIEYGMARALGRAETFTIDDMRQAAETLACHRPPVTGAEPDWMLVEDQRIYMTAPFDPDVTLNASHTPEQQARGECLETRARPGTACPR